MAGAASLAAEVAAWQKRDLVAAAARWEARRQCGGGGGNAASLVAVWGMLTMTATVIMTMMIDY
jgi:hypothetical protein